MRKAVRFLLVACIFAGGAFAQSPQVLNTFDSGTEGWVQSWGTGITSIAASGGALTWVNPGGISGAISDSWNNTGANFQPGAGGVDLTGLSALEFDITYSGTDTSINVQFFVQASANANYVALGADQTIAAGTTPVTYRLSLASLTAAQKVYVRTWGINIRSHTSDATFILTEVRSVLECFPLTSRVLASFSAGSPDNGFNSAMVNFDNAAVVGNNGAQNQTGLVVDYNAGTDGALTWTDAGGSNGGAVNIFNGYSLNFAGRPLDLSNYDNVDFTVAAVGAGVPITTTIPIQFFSHTGSGYSYKSLSDTTLVVDGQFHTFSFPLSSLTDSNYVNTLGVNLGAHDATMTIQIDQIGVTSNQSSPVLPLPSFKPTNYKIMMIGDKAAIITDPTGTVLTAASPADLSGVTFNGTDKAETLTIDFCNGAFNIPITFNGGAGGPDKLVLNGNGATEGTYTPGATAGSGVVVAGGGTFTFTGLEPVSVSDIANFSLVMNSNLDVITVQSAGAGQGSVSGTADGAAFETLFFSGVDQLSVDSASTDDATGTDTITVVSSGLHATGLDLLSISTGAGNDVYNINTAPDLFISLNGGDPVTAPADTLNLSTGLFPTALRAGTIQVGGVNAITYQSIESIIRSGIVSSVAECVPSLSALAFQPSATDDLNGNLATVVSGGWHPANTNPADQQAAFTDGATLGGLTGLLNDFPGENVPALVARWDLGGQVDLNELRVFSGNNGRDGRVFHHYDVYVTQQTPPTSGFTLLANEVTPTAFGGANPASPNDYIASLTVLQDALGGKLASAVTGLEIHFYSVSNTARRFDDDWNAGNGDDRDGNAAAFESPLIFEVDADFDKLCSDVAGLWDFDMGNLNASTGNNLTYRGNAASLTQFDTTTNFGIADINGTPAKVMKFGAYPQTDGIQMFPGIDANGGGAYVNQFSLVMDLYYPSTSTGYRALLQTSPDNSNDGDLFIHKTSNGIGISSNYQGNVTFDAWHRIAVTFDLTTATLTKYIDGTEVGVQTLSAGLDGRWSLNTAASGLPTLLFSDEDGEVNVGYTNSIAILPCVLNAGQVALLGGASADGIFPSIAPPPTETPTSTITLSPTVTNTLSGNTPTPTPTPGNSIMGATFTLLCNCNIGKYGTPDPVRIRIMKGDFDPNDPAPENAVACDPFDALAEYTIDSAAFVSIPCDVARQEIINQLVAAINSSPAAAGLIIASTVEGSPGTIFIDAISTTRFYVGLCSPEIAFSDCDDQLTCYPLSWKPIYNVADGSTGNESELPNEFQCGLGFAVENVIDLIDTPTPTVTKTIFKSYTPTPTNTVTETFTYTPTDTLTITRTDTPTDTFVPTDTVTNTLTDTPVPTETWTATPTDTEQGPFVCTNARAISLVCAGETSLNGLPFMVRVVSGDIPDATCGPVVCTGSILATFIVDPASVASESPFETPFSCDTALATLYGDIFTQLEMEGMHVTTGTDGRVVVQNNAPFHFCLCSDEPVTFGISCRGEIGWPIDVCGLGNLGDGISGNESSFTESTFNDVTSGLGIIGLDDECPATPTPTFTESGTPTISPTFTATFVNTDTPTPTITNTSTETPFTFTPTFTNTATNTVTDTATYTPTNTPTNTTLIDTPTFTPTEKPFECFQAMNLTLVCAGPTSLNALPFNIRLVPEFIDNTCGPVACSSTPYATVVVDPASVAGTNETPFSCDEAKAALVDSIVTQLNAQGFVASPGADDGVVYIQGESTFSACLCTSEAGLPCDGPDGWAIGVCGLANLGDGVNGNESPFTESDFNNVVSGLGVIAALAPCEEVTPTPTFTSSATPSPTATASDSPTFTFTATLTETSSPTATNTFTPTETPFIDTPTPTNTETPFTFTPTLTATASFTATSTSTPTDTATFTFTPTDTATFTLTPTGTAEATPTDTETPFTCADAANISLLCQGEVTANSQPFSIRLVPEFTNTTCGPVDCGSSPYAVVVVDLASVADEDPLDQTPFSCDEALDKLANSIIDQLNNQGFVASAGDEVGTVYVQGETAFSCCVCSNEAGLPCTGLQGWPIGTCGLANLGDGSGNETGFTLDDLSPFVSGMAVICAPAQCPEEPTWTPTPTVTGTATATFTETFTDTPTSTDTATETPTFTGTATETPTFTDTATDTPRFTDTPTDTPTFTDTVTETPTFTGTATETPTFTDTATDTPTFTDTATETPTFTDTATETPTFTDTATETPTVTGVPTDTPTFTDTATPTVTETFTPTPTDTSTPTVTPTPGCESGLYMLLTTGQIERVGHPPVITGGFSYTNDLARDLERAIANNGIPPTEDLVVLNGEGVVSFVENSGDNIPQDFVFPVTSDFPIGRAVDVEMSQSSEGFWVLTDFGGIYRAGDTKEALETALVTGTDVLPLGYDVPFGAFRASWLANPGGANIRAVALVVIDVNPPLNRADGYVIFDSQGARYQFTPDAGPVVAGTYAGLAVNDPLKLLEPKIPSVAAGEPFDYTDSGYVWPFFPGQDICRDAEIFPDTQEGLVVYDGWGGIHAVPVDVPTNPVFFTRNEDPNNPGTLITTVGMPYIVLGFDDPETAVDESDATTYGSDSYSIFVDFDFSAGCPEGGFYTLDKQGGVWVFGTARVTPDSVIPAWTLPLIASQNAIDMELYGYDEVGD